MGITLRDTLIYAFMPLILVACVNHVVNEDGTIQDTSVDMVKLSDTYVSLAIEYQKRGANQIALERINLAVKANPANPKAYMVRAMIYQSLDLAKPAEDDFIRALTIDKNYSDAQINYAIFLCAGQRYLEAEGNFSKALKNPLYYNPGFGYYSRGKCELEQGKLELARQDLLKALSYPNYTKGAYLALKQLELPEELANYPDSKEAKEYLGNNNK